MMEKRVCREEMRRVRKNERKVYCAEERVGKGKEVADSAEKRPGK